MFRRPERKGPGLGRTVARTAVVAGTATAVSHGVSKKMAGPPPAAPQPTAPAPAPAQQMTDQIHAIETQHLHAAAPSAASGDGTDFMSSLQRLMEMKQANLLTDEEFTAAKAKLLA